MSDNKILCKKFIEVNLLKNKLASYPIQYREKIIETINDICEEISKEITKEKQSETYMFNKMEIKLYENNRKEMADKSLTLSELAQYNGKEGKNAYVAVKGVIYDVTSSNAWNEGRHFGLTAGRDLTSYFNTCHNKQLNLLEELPIVGKIIVN